MTATITDNKIIFNDKVHAKQAEFLSWDDYVIGAVWGRGAGKSCVGAKKVLQRRIEYPGSMGLAGTATHRQTTATTLAHFLKALNEWGIPYSRNHRPKDAALATSLEIAGITNFNGVVSLPNGSVQVFASLGDQAFDAWRGPDFADLWLDEARDLSYECMQVLSGCLRGYGDIPYQIIITTTPNGMDSWIYNVLVDESNDRYIANSQWSHANSFDNPFNPPDFVDRMRETMSDRMALQEIDAEFTSLSGAVWPELESKPYPQGNLIPWRFDHNADTYFAVDFGYRSPAVLVIQSIRPMLARELGIIDVYGKPLTNADIIIGEWLPTDKRMDELIAWVHDYASGNNPFGAAFRFKWGAYDPAGDAVGQETGNKPAEEFRKSGLWMERMPQTKNYRVISWGCELVASRFCNAKKERRLFLACGSDGEAINRKSSLVPQTLVKLQSYSFKDNQDNKPVDERPVKGGQGAPDHASDALRYYTVTRWGQQQMLAKR
jgi:phage terminase large subunit